MILTIIPTIRLNLNLRIKAKAAVGENCGIGPNGFLPGNRCATGGGKTLKKRSGEVLHEAKRDDSKVWRLKNGAAAPDHIQKLSIPPAWKNVFVNLDPTGDLFAQGVDVKGKIQPKYSANHDMKKAADKFGRAFSLMKEQKKILAEVDKDIAKGTNVEEAWVTKLVMKTGMRPGSEKETNAEHKSYGATTLEGRHIRQRSEGISTVYVKYVPGKKHGEEIETPILDKELGKELVRRSKKAGPTGRIFQTDAGKVLLYSKSKGKGGYKTKDHRTALACTMAIDLMKDWKDPPTNVKQYKKAVKEVCTIVADTLGNTPTMTFNKYVDPNIWSAWKFKSGA